MSDGTIKVPTWALPIGAAALSGAMVWGASQAQAQATQEEVDRIEAVVEKTVEEAQATGKLAAVNASKIEAIVDSLQPSPVWLWSANIHSKHDAKSSWHCISARCGASYMGAC